MSLPALAYVNPAPRLPLRFDSRRGCDRVRTRLYHDQSIPAWVMPVLMVVSEFVNGQSYAARLKRETVAHWAHCSTKTVTRTIQWAEQHGILEQERRRTHSRFVFRQEWLGRFRDPALPSPSPSYGKSRRDRLSHHEGTDCPFTGEPTDQHLPVQRDCADLTADDVGWTRGAGETSESNG